MPSVDDGMELFAKKCYGIATDAKGKNVGLLSVVVDVRKMDCQENDKSLRHPVFPGGHPSKY